MITRTTTKGPAPSTAVYSDCERHCCTLTREWTPGHGRLLCVMRTPSTATEHVFPIPKSGFLL